MSKLSKRVSGLSIASLAVVSLGLASPAYAVESDYPDWVVEDGLDLFVEKCARADFTVTIDGTEYSPGDVASAFSIGSDYSVSAGEGVEVGWVYGSVIQGNYGHGFAQFLAGELGELEDGTWEAGDTTVSENSGTWDTGLNGTAPYAFFPSVFYAECPGTDRFAYIQTFPGFSLSQVGYAATLADGVFMDDEATLISTELGYSDAETLVFAPLANFRNAAYAFWAMYLEAEYRENPAAIYSFEIPYEEDFTQGVWAWTAWIPGETYVEFASSFYSYSGGSDLTESSIADEGDSPSRNPSPSRDEVEGDPGIFLTVTGRVGLLFESSEVVYGAYAVAPNSAYQLSVQSITNPTVVNRVLASGRVNSGGHLEATTTLPRLTAGNYKITFIGTAANGVPLKLTNHVNVDATGKYTSISAERLQPFLP